MNTKVRQVLQVIVDTFKSGEILDAVAFASYPIPNIPSCTWSFTNRTLMFLGGTGDARGFRQWKEVNRWVKKGSKAIHILIPCFKKKVDEKTGDENNVLRFFKSMPVFRVEDTEGEKLDYELLELPDFPLLKRAEELCISVKAVPGDYRFHGYYSSTRNEICLATPEEAVFFHELAHAGHDKVKGSMKPGQDPFQEIVAELSAQALCRLVGEKMVDTIGNSYRYIDVYAEKINMKPYTACLKVMAETEKVLNFILKTDGCSILNPV